MSREFPSKEKRQRWLRFMQNLNPTVDPLTVQLMDRLRFVAHGLYLVGENSVDSTKLSLAKYRILLQLFFAEQEGHHSLNPSEISERQGTSRNTVSALIRQLEEDGLIERELDKADRRRFNIKITEAGKTAVNQSIYDHLNIINSCFAELSSDEQNTLDQLLTKVGQSVEAKLNS